MNTTANPSRCSWDCPVPCPLHDTEVSNPSPSAALEAVTLTADFVCPGCRAVYPQHCSPACPRQPDALGVLLHAVQQGGLLELIGPPAEKHRVQRFTGRLQSADGSRYVVADQHALGACIVELSNEWKRASIPIGEMHDHRCSRLRGSDTCNCGQGGKPKELAE